ncbi:leucine-rich repeat-containing protein 45-like [Copidosoma floridanum]|uniref:leucine-rich repeat-containing protein 45-like n=1 Tax=Copidosoma floridanum TaxID=29053 RepID=UPI0006C93F2F|nr:leucine-rich repeat-containing protein 45-like [Copidosoma floridanum]
MLDDAELFTELCDKHGLLPEPDIIEAVKLSCSTGELRLSHTSIIAGLCEVIAQVLSSSSTIKLVDLSDCMLLAKGLSCIFKALRQGSSVTCLYLKGNNISGPLVEQLGQVLSSNNTLKVMHIEWNNLGSQVDSFAKFCVGLSKNHHIEELDLRYNQISTLCADHFSTALRQNKSLKKLDLAWNSLGMSGGQKILQGVQHNRFLVSLNLKGNCVPSEIHSAIKDRIAENQKRQLLCETPVFQIPAIPNSTSTEEDDRGTQVKLRSRKKKKKRERSKTPMEDLRDSPLGDSGNEGVPKKPSKDSEHEVRPEIAEKIQALDRIIQERAASMDLLQTELVSKEDELKSIHSENEKLKTEIQKLKEEKEVALEEKVKELEDVKRAHAKAEGSWNESYKELEEAQRNTARLRQEAEAKNRNYEKELRKVSSEVQMLKEKYASTVQSHEDVLSDFKVETHRLKRDVQERENKYRIETNALKESLKETTEALEKCQEQLQKLRNELRESVEVQGRLKMKADEAERFASRTLRIEEALNRSKEEKEKLEEKLQESRRSVAQLQKQMIKVQEESLEPQKRYEALKLELLIERERSAALKIELQDERARMKEQTEQLQKMLGQINGLYAQLSEVQACHAEVLRVKDAEIEKLKGVVGQKTRELDDYKSEQVHRAHQFQAAVSKYFGTFGTN